MILQVPELDSACDKIGSFLSDSMSMVTEQRKHAHAHQDLSTLGRGQCLDTQVLEDCLLESRAGVSVVSHVSVYGGIRVFQRPQCPSVF